MDTSKFDQRIQASTEAIERIRGEMETALGGFANSVEVVAGPWLEATAEVAVRRNADRAKELGVAGLRNVKKQIETLQAKLPQIVRSELDSERWPHRDENWQPTGRYGENPYKTYLASRPAEPFDLPLRRVLGRLGSILIENGLAAPEEWRPRGGYAPKPYYPGAVDYTEEMAEAAARYAELYSALVKENGERADAEAEKSRAEAEDLWNQA